MVRNDEGLTKTYNRFHDPEERDPGHSAAPRAACSMDRAVLDAYGWTDIPTDCEFLLDYEIDEEDWGRRKKPYRYRWPDDVRDEVLARLLELNARRAEEEARAGAGTDEEAAAQGGRRGEPVLDARAAKQERPWRRRRRSARDQLVRALRLDLVGPGADDSLAEELLPGWVRPSNWYLTGFLVPAGAPEEQAADADEEDDLGETPEMPGSPRRTTRTARPRRRATSRRLWG